MPLLGTAAMLLSFDVVADAVAEHDRWHTHEHLPERLAIPGFLRGTRWIASSRAAPRYMVLYEVESLATLTSAPYLERLNHPSAWTRTVMPHYRGMARGFCSVAGSFGLGAGHACALVRFEPDRASRSNDWLLDDLLPGLPARAGLGSAHLLRAAPTAPSMTNEQRLRGTDGGVDGAVVVTGYDPGAVEAVGRTVLAGLVDRGAARAHLAVYELDYALARTEVEARASGPSSLG